MNRAVLPRLFGFEAKACDRLLSTEHQPCHVSADGRAVLESMPGMGATLTPRFSRRAKNSKSLIKSSVLLQHFAFQQIDTD